MLDSDPVLPHLRLLPEGADLSSCAWSIMPAFEGDTAGPSFSHLCGLPLRFEQPLHDLMLFPNWWGCLSL